MRDFASSDIYVSLGLSQTSYYALTSFRKEYLPYVPPSCASSDCWENCHWSTDLSVGRCTIIILQIRSFWAFGTILRHFQSVNTEHLAASTSCIVYNSTWHLAWMPDELSPAHNIWGREVRSGIALLGRNYARTEAVRTNQIVRAGFIRWWTDDQQ